MKKQKADWKERPVERTAHVLDRQKLMAAADAAGVASISAPRLARLAGCSNRTAWGWLKGIPVTEASDRALRASLGLPCRLRRHLRRRRPVVDKG